MALHDGPLVFLTDGTTASLTALPPLATLAAELKCSLAILNVSEAARARTSDARIAEAVAILPREKPPVTLVPNTGDPLQMLPSLAGPTGGILALLPERRGAWLRSVTGDDLPRMLRNGPFSVLALPSDGTLPPISRVLFPIDLSPRSAEPLDQTIELCRVLAAELHLLHVFGGDRLLPSEQDASIRKTARSPLDLWRIDQQRIRDLAELGNQRNVRTVAQTSEGRAHTEILRYAAAQRIDLIVMASHGSRTFEDLFRGSTTLQVIQRAATPVLAMRSPRIPSR